jgi:hypothetical protein
MEVHHHPHVERKNFKEYFLEFVMIFLAVTMGFFAENLREYWSDRAKESQYMHSLAEDLKKDTAALHSSIHRLQSDIDNAHHLAVLIARNQFLSQNDTTLLWLTLNTGHSVDIIFNDRTSSQLKSSGSFGLIRNRTISDSILQYWNNQIVANEAHDKFENIRMEHHEIGYKTFSWFKIFFMNRYMGADSSLIDSMPVKAVLNPGNLDEFLNITSNLFNEASFQYMPILKRQLNLATSLIAQIHQEYP